MMLNKQKTRVAMVAGLVGFGSMAMAQPAEDKSQYHLFNPTPDELMRDLSADRPDATESPVTVDAGHYQLEVSFVDYSHNDHEGEQVNAWNILDSNIKVGLLNNVDLQLVVTAYTEEESDTTGAPSETINGFGDITLRTKVNLWGNDGGETAFGVMPFVKLPSGGEVSNGHVEGGFIAMLGWDVAETWGLGFQAEVDAVYDEEDGDHHTEWSHTTVLGFDVAGPLGAYVEYLGIISTDSGTEYQAVFSGGLTWQVHANLVFDVGTQIGLNSEAEDMSLFAGMTVRF